MQKINIKGHGRNISWKSFHFLLPSPIHHATLINTSIKICWDPSEQQALRPTEHWTSLGAYMLLCTWVSFLSYPCTYLRQRSFSYFKIQLKGHLSSEVPLNILLTHVSIQHAIPTCLQQGALLLTPLEATWGRIPFITLSPAAQWLIYCSAQ